MLSEQKSAKVPIAILIGGGSKLPAIIAATKSPKSKFCIALVVSHKKQSEGVNLALANKIPAVYFNLPNYREKVFANSQIARTSFMRYLGWFIAQDQYAPKLLVFAGWDLIVDKNFLNFFKSSFGNGFAAINLHPALLPKANEKNEIVLPDKTLSPIIRGEQKEVLEEVITKNLSYFGPTIHFVAEKYDAGKVITREFIKVDSAKTVNELRQKLLPVEDKLLIEAINQVISEYL